MATRTTAVRTIEIEMICPHDASMSMSRAKHGAERKRRGKAVPILGAAGLSLTLASGASAATEAPAADVLTHNAGVKTKSLSVRRKSPTSAWRHSMSSTKKTPEHSGRAYYGWPWARVVPAGWLRWLWLLDGHLLHVPGVRERCLPAASPGPAGALARS